MKAMAGATLLVVATAAVIGIAVVRVIRTSIHRAFETQIDLVLDDVAHGASMLLLPPCNRDEIFRNLRDAVKVDGVVFCACFDASGDLLGYAGIPEFDEPLEARLRRLGPNRRPGESMRTKDGTAVEMRRATVEATLPESIWRELMKDPQASSIEHTAARPGSGAGDGPMHNFVVGTVLLGHTWEPVEQEFEPVQRQVFMIVAGIGAAAALLAWLAARQIVRPILELVEGTGRIARGDFCNPVVIATRDELALLAESFNEMTRELETTRERLARHTQELEETVQARTQELRDALGELQVLDKMKDGFVSSISHEFRTPLTSIHAFAEILHEDKDIDAATRDEFLGIILKESDHLGALVCEVIDLVKIESGEMAFRFEPVDVQQVVQRAVEQVEPRAREKGVHVEFLPSMEGDQLAQAPAGARWDSAKIVRLLHELMKNAVRFSPSGGHVTVRVMTQVSGLRIAIDDEGPGIAPALREAVFERFRQGGEPLTGKPRGQGLGLALCRLIARRHGGDVRALQSDVRGAHLVVDLPLVPPARARHDDATGHLVAAPVSEPASLAPIA